MLGIHGCYRVQANGLKFYAVSAVIAIVLEACLGSLTIIKKTEIDNKINLALTEFTTSTFAGVRPNEEDLAVYRLSQYLQNSTYKKEVDTVHTVLSCCSFTSNFTAVRSCFASNYHQVSRIPLPPCLQALSDYLAIKLKFIRCLAFMLLPVQVFCLVFDLMVIKTLKVTKDYEKLEREMSIRKRVKRISQAYDPSTTVVMQADFDIAKLPYNPRS